MILFNILTKKKKNLDDLFAREEIQELTLYRFHHFSNQIKETKCTILLAVSPTVLTPVFAAA